MASEQTLMDKIVSLCKRRGFVYPGSEIYGGLANSWDYGPLGAELKKNIKDFWWQRFVRERDDMVGVDTALIMNPKVWEATGHVATFSDPLVECKNCHSRFRADQIDTTAPCPSCDKKGMFMEPRQFNMMLKTFLGPSEDSSALAYLRPETAQGMFVDFKQVVATNRVKPPFGIAQVGKAFRNEITPGNFVFRTREFEQMEIEYFIPAPKTDADWQVHFDHWKEQMEIWLADIGADMTKVHAVEIPEADRAFYSKRTIDFEFEYPFGQKELYGLAYRTDYDLSRHEQYSGENMKFRDPETNEEYLPHVIEPTWGVDRTLLIVLSSAFDDSDPERVVLRLKPQLAPYKAAVFPLLRNKPELVAKARGVYDMLRKKFMISWDDRGNIGKRYLAQDEVGTPMCVTIDFNTLEDSTVTIRDRDTAQQRRVPVDQLVSEIQKTLE